MQDNLKRKDFRSEVSINNSSFLWCRTTKILRLMLNRSPFIITPFFCLDYGLNLAKDYEDCVLKLDGLNKKN